MTDAEMDDYEKATNLKLAKFHLGKKVSFDEYNFPGEMKATYEVIDYSTSGDEVYLTLVSTVTGNAIEILITYAIAVGDWED